MRLRRISVFVFIGRDVNNGSLRKADSHAGREHRPSHLRAFRALVAIAFALDRLSSCPDGRWLPPLGYTLSDPLTKGGIGPAEMPD